MTISNHREESIILPLIQNSTELFPPLNFNSLALNQMTKDDSKTIAENANCDHQAILSQKTWDYCHWGANSFGEIKHFGMNRVEQTSALNSSIYSQDFMVNKRFLVNYPNYSQEYIPADYGQEVLNYHLNIDNDDSLSVRISSL